MTESCFNPFSLSGKNILVSGASSGIGRQCAIDFNRAGANVFLLARNRERLTETLSMMGGDNHEAVSLDLTDYDRIPGVIAEYVNRHGKIDGLVNCAGISATLPLKQVDATRLEEFFAANVFSAIELTRQVTNVKNMNRGGSVIFFASIMGCVGESGKSLYGMTKGALISAARSLACELAKRHIRVNCISPGAILTPINEKLPHMADPEARKKLEEKHLLGLGNTCDISNGCIYLLSDASQWVTGQNLVIDGGYTAR